jgi:hypothetical protein
LGHFLQFSVIIDACVLVRMAANSGKEAYWTKLKQKLREHLEYFILFFFYKLSFNRASQFKKLELLFL